MELIPHLAKRDSELRKEHKSSLAEFVNDCHAQSNGQFCSAPGSGLAKARKLISKLPKDRKGWFRGKGKKDAAAMEKTLNNIGGAIDQEVFARIEECKAKAAAKNSPVAPPTPDPVRTSPAAPSRAAPGKARAAFNSDSGPTNPLKPSGVKTPSPSPSPSVVDCRFVIIPARGEERKALKKELLEVNDQLNGLVGKLGIPTSGPGIEEWAKLSIRFSELESKVNGNSIFNDLYSKTARQVLADLRPVTGKKFNLSGEKALIAAVNKVGSAFYSDEWIEDSNRKGVMSVEATDDRGSYNHYNNKLTTPDKEGVMVHEIGHRMEHTRPWIKDIESVFYQRRTGTDPLKSMNDVAGGGYGKGEKTRPDNFLNPYMGKDSEGRSYELFTMGTQMLQNNEPIYQDRDYSRFVLGILAAG